MEKKYLVFSIRVLMFDTLYLLYQTYIKNYESLFYSRKLDELFGGWKGSRGIGQY